MIAIEKPRIECADSLEDGSYGKFVVEPLGLPSATLSAVYCFPRCPAPP